MTPAARRQSVTILIAEDDPEDRLLTQQALAENRLANDVRFVDDGVELLAYLRREGRYAEPDAAPRPGVILVDLNMPRKDGREAIAEIKRDPELRRFPLVVLTTSKAEEDIVQSYGFGVSSYITKPVSFEDLIKVMRGFSEYWLEIVALPKADE